MKNYTEFLQNFAKNPRWWERVEEQFFPEERARRLALPCVVIGKFAERELGCTPHLVSKVLHAMGYMKEQVRVDKETFRYYLSPASVRLSKWERRAIVEAQVAVVRSTRGDSHEAGSS